MSDSARADRDADRRPPSDAAALETAATETRARLADRRVALSGDESHEELVSMLEAVERFEDAVESRGGDLFIDGGEPERPDDPHFVLPKRRDDERVAAYVSRLDEATAVVRRHRPIA